jgi:hypothetical protein
MFHFVSQFHSLTGSNRTLIGTIIGHFLEPRRKSDLMLLCARIGYTPHDLLQTQLVHDPIGNYRLS